MRGEGERRQAGGGYVDADFFLQFADQCRFGGLAGVQLAAREFPQAGHLLALRPPRQQHSSVGVDQRAGGNQQQRFGARGGGEALCLRDLGPAEDVFARGLEDQHLVVRFVRSL